MANTITVQGIDFIDETEGKDGARIFVLADEQSASTVGVYTNEETLSEGISALKEMGRSSQEIWGEMYIANDFRRPNFSLTKNA